MATVKKRINISVPRETEKMIESLARRDQVPQATKARDLLERALEIEEDVILSREADSRASEKRIRWLSASQVWRKKRGDFH